GRIPALDARRVLRVAPAEASFPGYGNPGSGLWPRRDDTRTWQRVPDAVAEDLHRLPHAGAHLESDVGLLDRRREQDGTFDQHIQARLRRTEIGGVDQARY